MSRPLNEPPGIQKRVRRGGRLYHGCNICRLRKIRCDEGRPTCQNCKRSRRYICDGYEGRNSQEEGRAPENAESSLSPHFESSNLEDGDIDRLLSQFAANPYPLEIQQQISWPGHPTERDVLETPPLPITTDQAWLASTDNILDIPHDLNLIEGILPWIYRPNAAVQAPSLPRVEQQAQEKNSIPYSPDSNSPPQREETPHREEAPPANLKPCCPGSQESLASESFEISEDAIRLLDHYRVHVSQLMMPTSAPSHNPWLQLYLPLALQEPRTPAKSCLLFGLLAVAAFNKAFLPNAGNDDYLQQARESKDKASKILKSIVDPLLRAGEIVQSATEKHALLATILTMTTIEVFSGSEEGKGYENILLAKRVIRLTGGLEWWLSNPSGMTLLQIFRCLQLVTFTSGWSSPAQGDADEHVDLPEHDQSESEERGANSLISTQDLACQYTLDVSFGVSMKTLRCLSSIVKLSKSKTRTSNGNEWFELHRAEICRIEADLFGALHDPQAFSGQQFGNAHKGMPNYVSEEIKENHVWAFHYSTAIFYKRAICDDDRSIDLAASPIDESDCVSNQYSGQHLVSKALEHLENVDALSSDIAIANTLWPGFIASVEAVDMELRHRALIWFARAKRHGIGNIAKAKKLVMEVWRRVDRKSYASTGRRNMRTGLSHVDWREVMREKGMFIMLT